MYRYFIVFLVCVFCGSVSSVELYFNHINKKTSYNDILLRTIKENTNFTIKSPVISNNISVSYDIDGLINNSIITATNLNLTSSSYLQNYGTIDLGKLVIKYGNENYPSENFNIIQHGSMSISSIDSIDKELPYISNIGKNATTRLKQVDHLHYIYNKNKSTVIFDHKSSRLGIYVSHNANITMPFFISPTSEPLIKIDYVDITQDSILSCYVNKDIAVRRYNNVKILQYNQMLIDGNELFTDDILQSMMCGYHCEDTSNYIIFNNIRQQNKCIIADAEVLRLDNCNVSGLYKKNTLFADIVLQKIDIIEPDNQGLYHITQNEIIIGESKNNNTGDINLLGINAQAAFELKAKKSIDLEHIFITGVIDSTNSTNRNKATALKFSSTSSINTLTIKNGVTIDKKSSIISSGTPAILIAVNLDSDINNKGRIVAKDAAAFKFDTNVDILPQTFINAGKITSDYIIDTTNISQDKSHSIEFINTKSGLATGKFAIAVSDFSIINDGAINNLAVELYKPATVTIINNNNLYFNKIGIANLIKVNTSATTSVAQEKLIINNNIEANCSFIEAVTVGGLIVNNKANFNVAGGSKIDNYLATAGNLGIYYKPNLSQDALVNVNKAVFATKNGKKSIIILEASKCNKLSATNVKILQASSLSGDSIAELVNNDYGLKFLYGNHLPTNNLFLLACNAKIIKTNNKSTIVADLLGLPPDMFANFPLGIYHMEDALNYRDYLHGVLITEVDKRHLYYIKENNIHIGRQSEISYCKTIYASNTDSSAAVSIEFTNKNLIDNIIISSTIDARYDMYKNKMTKATALAINNKLANKNLTINNIKIDKSVNIIGNNAPAITISSPVNTKINTKIHNEGFICSYGNKNINDTLSFIATDGSFSLTNSGIISGRCQALVKNFYLTNKNDIKDSDIQLANTKYCNINNTGNISLFSLAASTDCEIVIDNKHTIYVDQPIASDKLSIINRATLDISYNSKFNSYDADENNNTVLMVHLPDKMSLLDKPLLTINEVNLSGINNEKIVLHVPNNVYYYSYKRPIVILKANTIKLNGTIIDKYNFKNELLCGYKTSAADRVVEIFSPKIINYQGYQYITGIIKYFPKNNFTDLNNNEYLPAKELLSDSIEHFDIRFNSKTNPHYIRNTFIVIGKENEIDTTNRTLVFDYSKDFDAVLEFYIEEDKEIETIIIDTNIYASKRDSLNYVNYSKYYALLFSGKTLTINDGILILKHSKLYSSYSPAIVIATKIKGNISNSGDITASYGSAFYINSSAYMLDGKIINDGNISGEYAFYSRSIGDYNDATLEIDNLKDIKGKFRIAAKNFIITNSGNITDSAIEADPNSNIHIHNKGLIVLKSIYQGKSSVISIDNLSSGKLIISASKDLVLNDNLIINNHGDLQLAGSLILPSTYTNYGTITAKNLFASTKRKTYFNLAKGAIAKFSNVGDYGSNIEVIGPGKLRIEHSTINGNLTLHQDHYQRQDGELELVNNVEQQTGLFTAGVLTAAKNYCFTVKPQATAYFTRQMSQPISIINDGCVSLQNGSQLASYSGDGKLIIAITDTANKLDSLLTCTNNINFTKYSSLILKPQLTNLSYLNKKINILTATNIKYENKKITADNINSLISIVKPASILLQLIDIDIIDNNKIVANLLIRDLSTLTCNSNHKLLQNMLVNTNIYNANKKYTQVTKSSLNNKILAKINAEVAEGKLPKVANNIVNYLLYNKINNKNKIASIIKQQLLVNNNSQALISSLLPVDLFVNRNILLTLATSGCHKRYKHIFENNFITNKEQYIYQDKNNYAVWLDIKNNNNKILLDQSYFSMQANSKLISLGIDNNKYENITSGMHISYINTNLAKLTKQDNYINNIKSLLLAAYIQYHKPKYKLQLSTNCVNNYHEICYNNNLASHKSSCVNLMAGLTVLYNYNKLQFALNTSLSLVSSFTPRYNSATISVAEDLAKIANIEIASNLIYKTKVLTNKLLTFMLSMSYKCTLFTTQKSNISIEFLGKNFSIDSMPAKQNIVDIATIVAINLSKDCTLDINFNYKTTNNLSSKLTMHYIF